MINNLYLVSNEKEAVNSFNLISEKLFNEYLILNNSKEYRLQEIEFYLYSENHPDTTCHRGERQKMCNQWYVHRFGKKLDSAYATFNTKVGLDMVFSEDKYILSILIRGIVDIKNGTVFSGPIKVLNELYGDGNKYIQGAKNYEKYLKYSKKLESKGIFDSKNLIYLKKTDNLIKNKYEFNVRTGLNSKVHGEFADRLYKCKII